MADSAVATQTGSVTGSVLVDKNKTPEQYLKDAEARYIVPRLVRDKYPDLVKLIFETESMNEEEREYWLQIMPIMTEEQIVKFRNILVTEKTELDKLDKEYQSEMSKIGGKPKEIDEAKLKETIQTIKADEQKKEEAEKSQEDALLNQLDNL